MPSSPMRVAIIGAGLAGLTCARELIQSERFRVTLFEKSRGIGGRSATRRHASAIHFDHGAQYFTARDERFQLQVTEWLQAGVAAEWTGQIVTLRRGDVALGKSETVRYVGVPGMSSLARHLAMDLTIRRETRVQRVERVGNAWRIWDDPGQDNGLFDLVISTAPPIQTRELVSQHSPWLAKRLEGVEMLPCWAVMAQFSRRLNIAWDGAFVQDSQLAWVARNNSKPGRSPSPETWVLHASPEWSSEHLERTPEEVVPDLCQAFQAGLGEPSDLPEPEFAVAHRWRYALPREPLQEAYLDDPEQNLAVAGDWCGGPRIEGAFLSGLELAAACQARYC
jgi:renalase